MFLGPWACGSECCSSNSNAPDISQKGLIGIQSHHSREKMSKKAREKPAKAGSASVSPYGSVLGYELVTSQPNRLINLIWPECRTWFIGPWEMPRFLQIRLGSESCDQISASPNGPKRAKSRDKTAGSLFTRVYTLVEFSQTKRYFFSFLKQNIQRQMIHQHHYRLHNTIHISLKTR